MPELPFSTVDEKRDREQQIYQQLLTVVSLWIIITKKRKIGKKKKRFPV